MNPVKTHPVTKAEYVDEGDDETMDSVLKAVDRGFAEWNRKVAAKKAAESKDDTGK